VRRLEGATFAIVSDVSDEASVGDLADEVVERAGVPDIVHNNAGR
jgi:NAD(P)-dependent dehydrogenase (short-subunit alcohol dehydrogenase family)